VLEPEDLTDYPSFTTQNLSIMGTIGLLSKFCFSGNGNITFKIICIKKYAAKFIDKMD
jgi:hypothetical protein